MENELKNEIIKNTIQVGNSAGVLLPKAWLNSRVKIILEPLNVEKDVLDILMNENLLKDILGIYIVGSYARKEETIESDVDILVITNKIDKKIKKGKYEIILISIDELKNQIEKNALPLIPMLREAKPIINSELLSSYQSVKLTKKNLRFHIETTKSALKIIKKFLELKDKKISDNIVYSLILRLRGVYIIECIIKNKTPKNKEFLELIKKISSNEEAYFAYKRAKEKSSKIKKLTLDSAEKIYEYIKHGLSNQEKWIEKEENN